MMSLSEEIKVAYRHGVYIHAIRYWKHGKQHRINRPAVIFSDGGTVWMQYGQYHNMNGPVIGGREYYFIDRYYIRDEPCKWYKFLWMRVKSYVTKIRNRQKCLFTGV